MKKIITLITIIILPLTSFCCDICGCGVGNNYIGILPEFHKHILGLRYRYNSIYTHVGVGGSTSYLTTREIYQTAELWGGWNVKERFRIMGTVPYSFNQKKDQEASKSKSGIGDISISGVYEILNSKQSTGSDRLLVQSLWVGGGIKLATGKYNPSDKSTSDENTNLFQLGTGSYDFNLALMYDLRLQDAGININSNYKINTANKYDYKYGNKISINTQAYYKFRIKGKYMIAPNAGIQYENGKTDSNNDFVVTASGGSLVLGTAGLETAFDKFAIGANFQTPLTQDLANGIGKAENRLMIHVAIAL